MINPDIVALLQTKENFLLLIHHSPDGDAIASSLGLSFALRSLGKRVDVVCADPIPLQFAFLPSAHAIQRDFLVGDYEVIITLDCGDSRRTGFRDRLKELARTKHKYVVNIDHHPKNDLHNLATHNFVDDTAPSTSYLVYLLIRDLGIKLDYRIATCLLTGLYTDTGGFKHPNTTPQALTFAATLLSYGARLKDITTNITQGSTVSRLKLWGVALSRVVQHEDYGVIATYLTHADMVKSGAEKADIAGIVSMLMTIPSRLVMLVLHAEDGSIEVRMRTRTKDVDLSQFAEFMGGGGQKRAAGFTVVAREMTL